MIRPAGLTVATLDSGRYEVVEGAEDPLWTADGLTVSQAGQRLAQTVTEADLSQYQPASGPVKLPKVGPAEGHSLPPAPPASPDGIFLYRPVKASTRISAFTTWIAPR